MARDQWHCSRCGALLARVEEPDHVLHIEAPRFTYNVRFCTLTLHCGCSDVKTITVPRKVDVFSSERVSKEAA